MEAGRNPSAEGRVYTFYVLAHQESIWIWDVVVGDNAEASLKPTK
jgi:hypothetical protein